MSSAGFRQAKRLAAFGLVLLALPVAADETRSRAEYTVTMGGTHVANVTIVLTDNGSQYSLALDAKIAGLAQLVANGTAKATSTGVSGANAGRSRAIGRSLHGFRNGDVEAARWRA